MEDHYVHVAGELWPWPDKQRMGEILRSAGLSVTVGRYSIRIDACSHFVFEHLGGDLGEPTVAADADSLEKMKSDCSLVSGALARAGVKHRFELYDASNQMVGYLHHDWPLGSDAPRRSG